MFTLALIQNSIVTITDIIYLIILLLHIYWMQLLSAILSTI